MPTENVFRDVFGDTTVVGDLRWAGSYGIDADFVAGEHCCVAQISVHQLLVLTRLIVITVSCVQFFRSKKLF